MQRTFSLVRRDWISTTRDAILIYAVVAPILLAFGMRLFMPQVGQASINLVLPEKAADLAEKLEPYANVERVAGEAELRQRVLAYDDAVGLLPQASGGYRLVLEGNESHDSQVLPGMILQQLADSGEFDVRIREVGAVRVPYRDWAGVFIGLSVIFISSVIMGLHIIEDKESRMMAALGVTPLSRGGYVLARSLFMVLIAVVVVFGSLLALGVQNLQPGMVLAVTLASAPAAALFGFVLGALSGNQITGIANMKFGFLLVVLPAVLTLLIPERFWMALYWLPTYWTFTGFKLILVEDAGWARLWPVLLWTLGTSLLFLGASFTWLKNRLDFARS